MRDLYMASCNIIHIFCNVPELLLHKLHFEPIENYAAEWPVTVQVCRYHDTRILFSEKTLVFIGTLVDVNTIETNNLLVASNFCTSRNISTLLVSFEGGFVPHVVVLVFLSCYTQVFQPG